MALTDPDRQKRRHGVVCLGVTSLGLLALGAAALLAAAFGAAAADTGASLQSRYTGKAAIAADGVLTAQVPKGPAVAAVTFELDGRPLASDAVAPYAVSLLAGEVPLGVHAVVVEVVYRSGERRHSRSTLVTVSRPRTRELRTIGSTAELRRLGRRLARGHLGVKLLPGRYDVRDLHVGSHVTFVGSGPATVLRGRGSQWGVLSVTGRDVTVADLTIDGGGAGGAEHGITVEPGARGVTLKRVAIERFRASGVYAWGRVSEITVQDSAIDGGGSASAGVIARMDDANDISVIRTRIKRTREFGILLSQPGHDNHSTGLRGLALDNGISDVDDPSTDTQGRSKGGIWTGGARATIVGNRITRVGWDGIETVGSSFDVSIASNAISNTKVGIYLEHATTRSTIRRNSIKRVETGINVEWEYDGVGSSENGFLANTIAFAKVGIFVDYGSDRNVLKHNVFAYGLRPAIILQGASTNQVVGNRACGSDGALVREQAAAAGPPTDNVITRNTTKRRCS